MNILGSFTGVKLTHRATDLWIITKILLKVVTESNAAI